MKKLFKKITAVTLTAALTITALATSAFAARDGHNKPEDNKPGQSVSDAYEHVDIDVTGKIEVDGVTYEASLSNVKITFDGTTYETTAEGGGSSAQYRADCNVPVDTDKSISVSFDYALSINGVAKTGSLVITLDPDTFADANEYCGNHTGLDYTITAAEIAQEIEEQESTTTEETTTPAEETTPEETTTVEETTTSANTTPSAPVVTTAATTEEIVEITDGNSPAAEAPTDSAIDGGNAEVTAEESLIEITDDDSAAGETPADSDSNSDNPHTADDSNIALVTLVALVSIIGAACALGGKDKLSAKK